MRSFRALALSALVACTTTTDGSRRDRDAATGDGGGEGEGEGEGEGGEGEGEGGEGEGEGGEGEGEGGEGEGAACDDELHAGEATYYDFADGSGNCGFDPTPDDLMVGAMNHTDYADSAVCGACAHLTGPDGQVTVRIVDRCPECPQGDVDLSPEAFALIADIEAGRVPITWTYVPCDVQGPILYHFKEGSNQWWTAVQIRNHRHAVARFEYMGDDGAFHEVFRESYNYFVESNGMGPGPYTFRVTDVYGSVVEDAGIPHEDDASVPGGSQLPDCVE